MVPDIELLRKLSSTKEFAHYLDLLHTKADAARRSFPELVITPEDQAAYNQQRGFIRGLDVACTITGHYLATPINKE